MSGVAFGSGVVALDCGRQVLFTGLTTRMTYGKLHCFTASLLHYYTVDRSRSTHDLKGFYRRQRAWTEKGSAESVG